MNIILHQFTESSYIIYIIFKSTGIFKGKNLRIESFKGASKKEV